MRKINSIIKDFITVKSIVIPFRKVMLIVLLQLLALSNIYGQGITVTGTVSDESGAIPGVSVSVKGTTQGTITGPEGKYSIKVPNEKVVLVYTFVGFTSQEITVGTKRLINVQLQINPTMLNEVTVIDLGFSTEKRSDLTGSIGSVNVKALQKAPVRSFEEGLAGRVAGVQVTSSDGQPGDALNIIVRGASSVNNSNAPLYIIDGFPQENPDNNSLNPAEIESITVLKDASSTAIYGSRAANGVVVITTKKGKIGEPVINYDAYYANSIVTGKVKLMNAYDFVALQNEIDPNFTLNNYFNVNGVPTNTLETFRTAPTLDFQDKLYKSAPFSNHFISLTGGTEKTRYSFSGGFTDQDGVIINSGFQRSQGRLSIVQKVGKKLSISTNINYAATKSNGVLPREQGSRSNLANSATNNLLYRVWSYRPVTGSLDPTALENNLADSEPGSGSDGPLRTNPVTSALNEYNGRFGKNFSAATNTTYQFNKNFSYRLNASVAIAMNRNEIFNNEFTNGGRDILFGPNGSIGNTQFNNFNIENIFTYTKKFNEKNNLTVIGLTSQQWRHNIANFFSANQVLFSSLGVNGLKNGIIQAATPGTNVSSDANQLGFGGSAIYSFMDKYVFKANLRADASSKFAKANRWGYFPSGGFAWKLSEENFMKDVKFISDAKLRVSYGSTGNNRVSDFAYLSGIGRNNTSGVIFGNTLNQGFFQTSLGNEDLKWETTTSLDFGLEFGLFSNFMTVELDYYKKKTKDLLLDAVFPMSSGFRTGTINVGKTSNEGIELSLNTYNLKSKNFSWTSNFNVSFNKNRLVELTSGSEYLLSIAGGIETTNNYIARVGSPLGSFYGYTYEGVYQYDDFDQLPNGAYLLKSNVVAPNGGPLVANRATVKPGDPKYRDINGDGVVTSDDQGIIGNGSPTAIGGLNNDFAYKGFDLNIFFQWAAGGENLNANRFYLERPLRVGNNQFESYNNRWSPTNSSNYAPRVLAQGADVWSSRFIEDASFIRLKTVSLGYKIPEKYLSKIKMKSARIYTAAQNLLTFTNYSGPDPEANVAGLGLTPGFDFSAYPRALTYTIGLNISL
jgi:TonB-dependent starch-binding outer membrane protein SusC